MRNRMLLVPLILLCASTVLAQGGWRGWTVMHQSPDTFTVGSGMEYSTIQAAIDAASSGDTVLVYPGTYTVTTPIYLKSGVDLVGVDWRTCIIRTVTADVDVIRIDTTHTITSDVAISNLSLIQHDGDSGGAGDGALGIDVTSDFDANVRFDNCLLQGYDQAIHMRDGGPGAGYTVRFDNCFLHSRSDGVESLGGGTTFAGEIHFRNCSFRTDSRLDVPIDYTVSAALTVWWGTYKLYDCTIDMYAGAGDTPGGPPNEVNRVVGVQGDCHISLYNCTFKMLWTDCDGAGNDMCGVYTTGATGDISLYNCTFDVQITGGDNPGYGYALYNAGGGGTIRSYDSKIVAGCVFGDIIWASQSVAPRQMPSYSTDFLESNIYENPPFRGGVLASGTNVWPGAGIVTAHHPGVVHIRSSTTTNSGGKWLTEPVMILLGGKEYFEAIVNPTDIGADTTVRVGFMDTTDHTDNVDGAYFELSAGTLKGKTATNSTRSTTGTTYTPSTATWYRLVIMVKSDASRVDFYIYNDAGTILWTNSLTTNIPTAVGRETGAGIVATNVGTTQTYLIHVDYMGISFGAPTGLTR